MLTYGEFQKIKRVHIASLFSEKEKFVSYKNISIAMAIHEIEFRGDWFQFGVFKGHTARIMESLILSDQKLHLFDSFEGLPEDWSNTSYGKGAFRIGADDIPLFSQKHTVVHKGLFKDTIPSFTAKYAPPRVPFIHLDADLYSSTMDILMGLNHLIAPGTLLLFDELFLPNEKGLSNDECRALFDWADEKKRNFQILWRTEWVQCAVKVLS